MLLSCEAFLTCQTHLESGFVARALAVVGPDRGGVRNGGRKLRDAPLESLDEGWERHGELRWPPRTARAAGCGGEKNVRDAAFRDVAN